MWGCEILSLLLRAAHYYRSIFCSLSTQKGFRFILDRKLIIAESPALILAAAIQSMKQDLYYQLTKLQNWCLVQPWQLILLRDARYTSAYHSKQDPGHLLVWLDVSVCQLKSSPQIVHFTSRLLTKMFQHNVLTVLPSFRHIKGSTVPLATPGQTSFIKHARTFVMLAAAMFSV